MKETKLETYYVYLMNGTIVKIQAEEVESRYSNECPRVCFLVDSVLVAQFNVRTIYGWRVEST